MKLIYKVTLRLAMVILPVLLLWATVFYFAMVSEVNERLNVRSMLMWLITEYADAEPCRWIPELEDTLARAQDAVRELEELKAALEDLRAELAEARWAVGV